MIRLLAKLGTFAAALTLSACNTTTAPLSFAWPPTAGETYPELELLGLDGETVNLASYRGRVLLIEPIGMTWAGCNAFAGANDPAIGPIHAERTQANFPSLDDAARDYGGFSLEDDRLVVVQLLLYGFDMNAPSVADARDWAEHYGLDERENHVVLVGDPRMLASQTRAMIPGLQLVDRDFVLRYDSTGKKPEHDMWTELLPAVPQVLAGSEQIASR